MFIPLPIPKACQARILSLLLIGATCLGVRAADPATDFDLVVIGATPGGIACAVRAASDGQKVLLTNHNSHVGGMLSNGLGVLDTQYSGQRSPILTKFCKRVLQFYRDRYGADSAQYRSCFAKVFSRYDGQAVKSEGATPLTQYFGRINLEPHVAETVFQQMIGEASNVTLWTDCSPVAVDEKERLIRSVTLQFRDGRKRIVKARTFADCAYEGDLLALAGAPYRVGRESRAEFGEMHAGRIFTALHFATPEEKGYPLDAVEGRLNLEPYEAISQQIYAGSTGEGDRKIQAYTFRLILCSDPDNRVMPERPANYDREIYLRMRNRWGLGAPIANNKLRWNTSNLPGGAWDYPEADEEGRKKILQRHLDHAIGFLWFLQHDEAVPPELREKAGNYGLAKDEFPDNGHVPWEMYVREARRLTGRSVFTENDATLAPGLQRAPIHADSIAITEWGMDSHSVSEEVVAGCPGGEGKILLTELTRPGQVSWRCLLPPNLDNLVVPVCLSATHVGWGTIRLEPTWMHLGESAAAATTLAWKSRVPVADLDPDALQRQLVESGIMISFFNEFDMASPSPWVAAVQFLGTKGFFSSYDAAPNDLLDAQTAKTWSDITSDILTENHQHPEKEDWGKRYPIRGSTRPVEAREFRALVQDVLVRRGLPPERLDRLWQECEPSDSSWTRGQACLLFYVLLKEIASEQT